jgi:hypothetical protein
MRSPLSAALATFALVAFARDANAQTAPGGQGLSNEMRAEQLFRSGEKKFDSGKHAEACADFKESLHLGPKLGTLLNLALCHETVGRPATAWSEYHYAAAWAAQNGQKDRHDFALQHAVALETKLPRVLLQLPAESALASVDVDGEPLPDSRWYLPIYLDPGEHSVTVGAPGKQRSTTKFRVTLSPTEQLVSVPSLSDAKEDSAAAPGASADPDSTRRLAGIVTLGTGGALLLVGIGFGVLAIDSLGGCVESACVDDAKSQATIATVATVVGAAAAVAGGWLIYTSRGASAGPGPRASIGFRGLPSGAQLGAFGSF